MSDLIARIDQAAIDFYLKRNYPPSRLELDLTDWPKFERLLPIRYRKARQEIGHKITDVFMSSVGPLEAHLGPTSCVCGRRSHGRYEVVPWERHHLPPEP